MNIKPFQVHITDEALTDLQHRLSLTRWPDEVVGAKWDYGIPLQVMQGIVSYWANDFNWRAVEQRINALPNFTAEVNGMSIHFIHVRGKGPNPQPLLLLHGWPSSFYEMLDMIPYLTDPASFGGDAEQSFDVIIPSIPGHGFSDVSVEPAFEDRQVAHLLVSLMQQLGYDRFGIHAYDLGSSISGLLCLDVPHVVTGYHTTNPGNPSPPLPQDRSQLTVEEQQFLSVMKSWDQEEGGYSHILGTRPQTYAYGLNDSPAGLAAFILEKWYAWTAPPNGQLDTHFKLEDLLANVSIYWFTQTINAANRYYYEGKHIKWPGPADTITVPTGVALPATQPNDRAPRAYVERLFTNIVKWDELGKGGHFVALEDPRLVASMIADFFKKLAKYSE
ncbi:epoxide hydrolase family protein [Paenibacillus sp. 481]|uniref:epoxide hydrolase family protein n=1 Tax=Paenibacillus sp. 481 TaxID=2835869 RepID=UPI001E4643A4|nr:epoxide hydrolase family protein [Paenibacillus sp. 481]UHA73635.1 epoxide hydrolase [Paenibacillus sp. 481]